LSGRLITAHEDERRWLARELHDDITQRVVGAAIDAARLPGGDLSPSTIEGGRSISDTLMKLSEDIHDLSYQLHPSVLHDLGLVEALKAECERVARSEFLSIHSCSLGAPILLEEANAAGVGPAEHRHPATPIVDRLRTGGQWNEAWTPFYNLDPAWTEQFMAAGIPVYAGGVLSPKLAELLSIAFDVSYTHMYAPGTRRHIKAALKLGATVEEIMEVLKLCVIKGVQACNRGVPIFAEELARTQ
jgi:alkylhydroperoxidase/carboxymuconolactone decarboxylase family protein YurZ